MEVPEGWGGDPENYYLSAESTVGYGKYPDWRSAEDSAGKNALEPDLRAPIPERLVWGIGRPFSFRLFATDYYVDGHFRWHLRTDPEVFWIHSDGTGVLYGTPATFGEVHVVVAAEDANGDYDTFEFTLVTRSCLGNRPPEITSEPLNSRYHYRQNPWTIHIMHLYQASDPDGDAFIWRGKPEDGRFIIGTVNGLARYTPRDEGTFEYMVTVDDGCDADWATLKVTVSGRGGSLFGGGNDSSGQGLTIGLVVVLAAAGTSVGLALWFTRRKPAWVPA